MDDGAAAGSAPGDFADRRMSELSGGQQQRVAIAQAIVDDADLLLLDEPLANLDLRNQQEVVRLLGDLHRERDVTIMVVAHDLNPLLPVLTDAIYLLDGHPHHDPITDVVQEELLTHLYGTPVGVVRTAQGDLFTRAAWRDAAADGTLRDRRWPPCSSSRTGSTSCSSPFMQHALIGGSLVALAAGPARLLRDHPAERLRRARAGAHRLPRRHRRDPDRRRRHPRAWRSSASAAAC